MTSVGIVAGAVARIEFLKVQLEKEFRKKQKAIRWLGLLNNQLWHEVSSRQYKAEESVDLLPALKKIEWLLMAAHEAGPGKAAVRLQEEEEEEIVQLSYEAVEAVERASKSKSWWWWWSSSSSDLRNMKRRLDKLVLNLTKSAETAAAAEAEEEEEVREEEGGDDVLYRAREDLLLSQQQASSVVVCIAGESGMGKTTLATRLFHDAQLRESLEGEGGGVFATWVSMNTTATRPICLVEQEKMKKKKKWLLVVADGVDNADDWEWVRRRSESSSEYWNWVLIIITTCSMQVAQLAARTKAAIVYKIPPLRQSHILTILNHPAPVSEKVGKTIYDFSGGSPLLALILKKSLLQSEAGKEQLALVRELASYMPHKGAATRALGFCYKRLLAPKLKPCLLYLANLIPQGQHIHVEKLYLLLLAERLISPMAMESSSSEIFLQPARDVLEELASRMWVQVQQDYKSCTLHDQVRNFCRFQGLEEEFLEIVDLKNPTRVRPNTRRLFIYLSRSSKHDRSLQFITPQNTVTKIWSLIFFGKVSSNNNWARWPSEMNDLLKELIHLRVLDFNMINFGDECVLGQMPRPILKGIEKLVLLRHLSFRDCSLDQLPSSVSKLTHLETLDLLDVGCFGKLLIPHKILKNMTRLVHLYLPSKYECSRLYWKGKRKLLQLQALERLQVLVNLDASACNLAGLPRLKKLKILTTVPCEEPLDYYPMMNYYYLGMLQNLQSLVLANNAFVGGRGREIVVSSSAPHFPKLRTLKLHNLESLEELRIEQGAMPELITLEIQGCPRLQKLTIPQQVQDRQLDKEELLPPLIDY